MNSGERVENGTQTDVSLQPSALVSFVSAGGPRVGSSTTTEGTTTRNELRGGVFGCGGVTRTPPSRRDDGQKSPFVPIGDPFTPPRRTNKENFNTVSSLRTLSPLEPTRRDQYGPKLPDFEDHPREEHHHQPPPPPPQQNFYFGEKPPAATSHWGFVHTVAPAWGPTTTTAGTNWGTYSPLMASWVPMPVSPALTNLTSLYRRRVQNRMGAAANSTSFYPSSTSYGNVFF